MESKQLHALSRTRTKSEIKKAHLPPDQERKCAKSYGKVGLFVVPYFTISKSAVQPNKRTKGKIEDGETRNR